MRRFDQVFRDIRVVEVTLDFPSIGSKNSAFIDEQTAVGAAPLGTQILGFTPISTATTIDDLLVQAIVVATDTIRFTLQNPSAGAIDPDSIDFRVVTGFINPDLVEQI
jgi:hypothetical protein